MATKTLDAAWVDYSLGAAISPEFFWQVGHNNYRAPSYAGETRVHLTHSTENLYYGGSVLTVSSYAYYVAVDNGGTLAWAFLKGFTHASGAPANDPRGIDDVYIDSDSESLYRACVNGGLLSWHEVMTYMYQFGGGY